MFFIVGPLILPIKLYFKSLNFTASVFKDNSARRINSEQIIVLRVFEKGVESNHAAHIRASLGFQTFQILNADPSNSTWKYFVISKGTPKKHWPYESPKKTFRKSLASLWVSRLCLVTQMWIDFLFKSYVHVEATFCYLSLFDKCL